MSSRCGSCDAQILWVVSESGKAVPLDLAPDPTGRVVIETPDDPREAAVGRVLKKGEETTEPRFTSHFATCPDAEQHRRKS